MVREFNFENTGITNSTKLYLMKDQLKQTDATNKQVTKRAFQGKGKNNFEKINSYY